jgi:cyclophilin family peptidyl-prolyl cis-trans isomerase
MLKNLTFIILCFVVLTVASSAQEKLPDNKAKQPELKALKKANQRSDTKSAKTIQPEPFETATVEAMAKQCVKFDTEAGIIEMEMFPESAPESVRSFLNLAGTGAFDTTTFSRVVPGFIVQGGDIFTRQKMTPELDKRARRSLRDEPSLIKHERGIVSMARSNEPNSATTNFFILVGTASHLDGTFAAFGRVTKGMEVVDAINKMPVEGDKPTKPVRITRATAALCPAQTNP